MQVNLHSSLPDNRLSRQSQRGLKIDSSFDSCGRTDESALSFWKREEKKKKKKQKRSRFHPHLHQDARKPPESVLTDV